MYCIVFKKWKQRNVKTANSCQKQKLGIYHENEKSNLQVVLRVYILILTPPLPLTSKRDVATMSKFCFAVALAYVLVTSPLYAQTPLDASDTDPSPSIFAGAALDGTIDVAWRRSDGRIVLSACSGPNWSNRSDTVLATNLQLLAGMGRDEAGNRYVAVMRRETATAQDWANGYRPGVAHVLRVAAGSNQTELLADINKPEFTRPPIINALNMASNSFVNAEMLYNNGTLALAFGHNNGQATDIHQTGALIGIGTDGSVKYGNGGGQHPGQVKLAVTNNGFIKAQIFDQGIGLSTLKQVNGVYQWSDFVLVYEIPRANPAEEALTIAGVLPLPDGFLLVFSSGKGWLWNFNKAELGTDGSCAIKTMKVSSNFDQLPKFDWWNNVRKAQGNFQLQNVSLPPAGKSFIRPVAQFFPDGRSLVIYEQWGKPANGFGNATPEGVRATLLDTSGNPIANSQLFAGLRIQKSTRSFYVPGLNRIAWVNGDRQGNRLMMHAIGANMSLKSYVLGQGPVNSQPNNTTPNNNPTPMNNAPLTMASIVGQYQHLPVQNGYHDGVIEQVPAAPGQPATYRWRNKSDAKWQLFPDLNQKQMLTGTENPYFQSNPDDGRTFAIVQNTNPDGSPNGQVKGFMFLGVLYTKVQSANPPTTTPTPATSTQLTTAMVVGRYQRLPVENGYHDGVIEQVTVAPGQPAAFRWRNKSDVKWQLFPNMNQKEMKTGADNPYFGENTPETRTFKIVTVIKPNPDGSSRIEVKGFLFQDELYSRVP